MKELKRLAALALLLTVCLPACDTERYRAEEEFGPLQKRMMASAADLTRVPANSVDAADPYIKGKIVVFQMGKTAVNLAAQRKGDQAAGVPYFMQIYHYRELSDIYAKTPEEVGTVALLNCKTTQKGVYKVEDGRELPANAEDCELTLIDRTKDAVILRKSFEKEPPQDKKVYGNTAVRDSAQPDIMQFLKGLPRT